MSETGAAAGAAGDQAPAWAQATNDLVRTLATDPQSGLRTAEAARRAGRFGPNRLRTTRPRSAYRILLDQLRSIVVGLLALAAAVSFVFGELAEAIAIAIVLLINTALGFAAELRARRSMEALRLLTVRSASVVRGGTVARIDAAALVPGDVVVLDAGDVATADLRLLEAAGIEADESTLTGESLPVAKQVEPCAAEAPLAERPSMIFAGTAITRGAGRGVVTATGMRTELGRIAQMAAEAEDARTPLEARLDRLGNRLVAVTVVVAAAATLSGILAGKDLLLMFETGVALAVAAIPEGLPVVATIALARGMWRLSRRHALVRRLAAVETLGATTLILTDKTGTLTENRMTVRWVEVAEGRADLTPPASQAVRAALEVACLANNAALARDSDEGVGDPLEIALLAAADRVGFDRQALIAHHPRVHQEAFDASTRMMATYHRVPQGNRLRVAVKGAPEAVIASATRFRTEAGDECLDAESRAAWSARTKTLAAGGLRVLAVAERTVEAVEGSPYRDLELVGLVALDDPPREDVGDAIAACRQAGIRVVMVTGDQAPTAVAIARAVGLSPSSEPRVVVGSSLGEIKTLDEAGQRRLLDADVVARVEPAQKLDLVVAHQAAGAVVAMTGDGVNDAPALHQADIGIAMGRRGTDVAREAADMVLQDDAFGSIVEAVRHGRIIFANIRRFIIYLMACNLSEVAILGGGAAVPSMPLPILPLQILFLNLVTDVFPALALALGGGEPTVLDRPPRDPREPIVTVRLWRDIVIRAATIAVAVLLALFVALRALDYTEKRAITVSFLSLALAQLWHVFAVRERDAHWLRNEITRNPWVWAALALCVAILAGAIYLPAVAVPLGVTNPGARGWLLAVGASLLPAALDQLFRWIRNLQDARLATAK